MILIERMSHYWLETTQSRHDTCRHHAHDELFKTA